jgi:hypothetical protein
LVDAQLVNPKGDAFGRLTEVQECRLKTRGYEDCSFTIIGWITLVVFDN